MDKMEALEAKPQVRKDRNWIWIIVILIVALLFITIFYFLFSENSFWDIFGGGRDGDGDGSDSGSWLDNLGNSNNPDEEEIPAPPVLPS
jgi:hypothetical protein